LLKTHQTNTLPIFISDRHFSLFFQQSVFDAILFSLALLIKKRRIFE
jgi:hypothetical protein